MSGRTSFDAVLDENLDSVFNGTPNEVQEWLKDNSWALTLRVFIGQTTHVVAAKDYVRI